MSKVRIITEANEWQALLADGFAYDFYHTYHYHRIDCVSPFEMFAFSEADYTIAMPLVFLPIEGTPYFDVTSAYGYAGPVTNKKDPQEITPAVIQRFQEALITYLRERKVVTAFSRLHPLLDQHSLLQGTGEIVLLNTTVAMDLTQVPELQRAQYRKSTKSEVNQLRGKGYRVRAAEDAGDIDSFVRIYHQNMARLQAGERYYFSRDYFHEFFNTADFDATLLLAEVDGHITAGAIFTFANDLMQYHLAGTDEAYLSDTPMKLVLDEARLLGTAKQMRYLHLGGGVGGENDSLFRFKSGFSKSFFTFSIWKYILNNPVYDELVMKRYGAQGPGNSTYFPLYRLPEKTG